MISDTKLFGFWLYLMTDLVIFAVLFAAFLVLHENGMGGPTGHDIFNLSLTLLETVILLTSSFTCSLGMLFVHRKQKKPALFWFLVTLALGASFLLLELAEFSSLIAQGATWQQSAFLSSFFTLVGTHGLHILAGLLWMTVAVMQIWLRPLSDSNSSRILRMTLFWHFLDVVWIFIFTVVYGMGVL